MTKMTSSRTYSLGGGRGVEYIVTTNDTLEGIAARCDCTPTQLLKMNKLTSRLLFPGQKIFVPDIRQQQNDGASQNQQETNKDATQKDDKQKQVSAQLRANLTATTDGDHGSVSTANSELTMATGVEESGGGKEELSQQSATSPAAGSTIVDPQLDADCWQKFLKIRCKHFTDNEGVVSGVLLVTPNCLMFDPDVSHPLVIENGADRYGMVVAMDTIVSAALYKDATALVDEYGDKLTDEERQKLGITLWKPADNSIHSEENKAGDDKAVERSLDDGGKEQTLNKESPRFVCDSVENASSQDIFQSTENEPNVDAQRAELEAELAAMRLVPDMRTVLRRHVSDSGQLPGGADLIAAISPRQQVHSCPSELDDDLVKEIGTDDGDHEDVLVENEAEPLTSKRASLSKLRHSLRQRANTLGGTLVQGAQVVGSGVGTLVHGAQAVGGTLTTGAKAVVKMPQNLVNMSSGLFAARGPMQAAAGSTGDILDIQESWFSTDEAGNKTAEQVRKRQQNYALLARLQQKTAEARLHWMNMFSCATSKEEHPNLFLPVEDILPYPRQLYSDVCTELPYYLCIRLDEKRRQQRVVSRDSKEEHEFGNKTKTEFWFTVPRDKADTLYAFLIQWTPDLTEEETPGPHAEHERHLSRDTAAKGAGFVVLDVNDEEAASVHDGYSSQPGSLPASLSLNRQWEIVTVEEVKRRLSLLELLGAEPQPLPEGSQLSGLLDEEKIRALMEVLPARAQGYPWSLVYSSEANGFSLRTLYRNMLHWDEEISPTLLVIKDTNNRVFGAVVNCPLRVSDHFYGSGESLLFTFHPEFTYYRWTGANSFIVKGNNDSLSFGAGRGVYGLWLDGDLYHGRTQHCQTFENTPLAGMEDFIIAGVEAWGFSLSGL